MNAVKGTDIEDIEIEARVKKITSRIESSLEGVLAPQGDYYYMTSEIASRVREQLSAVPRENPYSVNQFTRLAKAVRITIAEMLGAYSFDDDWIRRVEPIIEEATFVVLLTSLEEFRSRKQERGRILRSKSFQLW